jgi:hypothetical protein
VFYICVSAACFEDFVPQVCFTYVLLLFVSEHLSLFYFFPFPFFYLQISSELSHICIGPSSECMSE